VEKPKGKVIIFSEFAQMCLILKRELFKYNPLIIIGDTPNNEREKIVDQFNNDDEHKILILSNAGQFGLNLQSKATTIIHFDLPWSIAKVEQREGRAHRYGQKETVLVYNLIAEKTIDEYVLKTLHNKAKLSANVLGDVPITLDDIRSILQ
jgi:SNF2 family DNA or RNA helicase